MCETLSKATSYVSDLEQHNLNMLSDLAIDWSRRAEGCGCNSCKVKAKEAVKAFQKEAERVNIWTPDHEEDWIMDWAIAQYLGGEAKVYDDGKLE